MLTTTKYWRSKAKRAESPGRHTTFMGQMSQQSRRDDSPKQIQELNEFPIKLQAGTGTLYMCVGRQMKVRKARATLKNINEGEKLILANCKTQNSHDQNDVVLVGSGSETHEWRTERESELHACSEDFWGWCNGSGRGLTSGWSKGVLKRSTGTTSPPKHTLLLQNLTQNRSWHAFKM